MKGKGFRKLIFIAIPVLLTGYLFLKPAFNYLSGFLSKSEQVQANILIVEGWLPENELDIAFTEFEKNNYDYIITTGLTYVAEYFKMPENGYLIFYPRLKDSIQNNVNQHTIDVDAYGSLNVIDYAHFNLYVNDSMIVDYYANKRKKRYSGKWNGSIAKIDSVMIQFTNDRVDENGDLNLFVKDIVIDNKYTIPYLHNTVFDMSTGNWKKRIINNFNSTAELARNWLLSKGIDSASVIAVPGEKVRINRTLTSALAFRDWLKETNINVRGINIVSSGTHARRTWMTYNKILDEKYKIGIISIPDYRNTRSKTEEALKTLRETAGIIYYWFILILY